MYQFILNNVMWMWLFVMIALIVLEAVTTSLISIWGAVSALVMIFISKTHLPLRWQLIIFLVLTIILILTTRPFAMKKLKLGKNTTNINSLIGQEVVVISKISKFEKGDVKSVSGVIWKAVSEEDTEISEGTVCTISKVDGNTLSIKIKKTGE